MDNSSKVRLHDELDVQVAQIHSWGIDVISEDGKSGFIDFLKVESSGNSEGGICVGDVLHVVVLDETRCPFRASALDSDLLIARELRTE